MKKSIHYIMIVCMLGLIVLSSCNKYVDGPKFSLLTKKARLTGDWKPDQVLVNNVDATSDFKAALGDWTLSIKKNEAYSVSGTDPETGKWKLGEDKDDIYLTADDPGALEQSFRILRLKNKELWLRSVSSNGVATEWHLKQ